MSHQIQCVVTLTFTCRNEYFERRLQNLLVVSKCSRFLKFTFNWRISLVQSLSRVRLFVTPWIAARQASLSITNSRSLPKHMPIESVTPSNHLILCRPLLLLPSIFPSVRVFSNESVCDKYHRLGDLNNRRLCFCGFDSWNLKI